jgi:hypothetical protein
MVGAAHSERRRSARLVPREPVRVDLEFEDGPIAHGVVADISEGGACVTAETTAALDGATVLVSLRFASEPQPVPATGRIVWTASRERALRCGLEWTHVGPHRARLQRLIGTLA